MIRGHHKFMIDGMDVWLGIKRLDTVQVTMMLMKRPGYFCFMPGVSGKYLTCLDLEERVTKRTSSQRSA
jgi:hypothetical protein